MAELLEYKCPSCGGLMEFDSESQKMKCPSCGTLLDVEAFEGQMQELSQQPVHAGSVWEEGEQEGMKVYGCNACGGEIIVDASTAATSCPYCGSNVVMKGQFADKLKPDYVIPFKLDKNDAKNAYRNHLKGKKFVPRIFTQNSYIDEIKGVYVPFWLFDMTVEADITYLAQRRRVWESGDTEYIETSEYQVRRQGTLEFEKVPADSSRKMDDAMMESLEAYDVKDMVPFAPAYLAGYYADRYDVPVEEGLERVRKRVKKSTEDSFFDTVQGYHSVSVRDSQVRMDRNKYYYALYPVWMLSTRWKGDIFTFAMNAQTGNLIGDLPFDNGSYWRYILVRTLVIGAILFALMWMFLR